MFACAVPGLPPNFQEFGRPIGQRMKATVTTVRENTGVLG